MKRRTALEIAIAAYLKHAPADRRALNEWLDGFAFQYKQSIFNAITGVLRAAAKPKEKR